MRGEISVLGEIVPLPVVMEKDPELEQVQCSIMHQQQNVPAMQLKLKRATKEDVQVREMSFLEFVTLKNYNC